jgi:deoxyribonuclease V
MWPVDAEQLIAIQQDLAEAFAAPWRRQGSRTEVGACWVCFPRGLAGRGSSQDPAWAAAVSMLGDDVTDHSIVAGAAGAPYQPGLLALRLGPLMDQVVRGLGQRPAVLLLDASGRDHPRRAGLAVQLGAVLDVPTVGVTHRPLLAKGSWAEDRAGATSPLRIGDEEVACWVRTRSGTRPVVVHPGWAMDLPTAVEVVMDATAQHRTPEPLRLARQLARNARVRAPASPTDS